MITLLPPNETTPTNSPRPLMFEIKDRNQLYSFYMAQLRFGGIFIPTQKPMEFPPGSKALILLTLLDEKGKKTITGKVCWQTPQGAPLGVLPGIGIAFDENEANKALKNQIETILTGILGKSDIRTQTL